MTAPGAKHLKDVLKEEAKAIHPDQPEIADTGYRKIYRALNRRNAAALCLSGGGIRSAAFALGVIQAFAARFRRPPADPKKDSDASLLKEFHYLSTVSGGGYIGSWLSAWIKRDSFQDVWERLTTRPSGPDYEPKQIANLRRNSNYLTPKLGVLSADSWTGVALYIRNLSLNWLVIGSAFCAVLLGLKLFAAGVASVWRGEEPLLLLGRAAPAIAIVLMIAALWFEQLNRPTRAVVAAGQAAFLRFALIPAMLSGAFWGLFFVTPHLLQDMSVYLARWPGWLPGVHAVEGDTRTALLTTGAVIGGLVYAAGWLAAAATGWIGRAAPRLLRGLGATQTLPQPPKLGFNALADFLLFVVCGIIYGVILFLGAALLLDFSTEYAEHHPRLKFYLVLGLAMPWAMMAHLTAEALFTGLTSYQPDSDSDREWFGRSAGWHGATALAWMATVLFAYFGSKLAAMVQPEVQSWILGMGGVSGIVSAVLSKSALSNAKANSDGPDMKGLIAKYALSVAAPIFAVVLVMLLSNALDRVVLKGSFLDSALLASPLIKAEIAEWPANAAIDQTRLWIGLAILLAVAVIASLSININRFSLHAMYRNRLIRAFLGATHKTREPNPFTGFDVTDNPHMHTLWPGKDWQIFHIINMALNVVSTRNLAWQERKAEPFTVSPLHAGSACKAYRSSEEYGDGISLGTAMAISGAAASPNMGYHSAPSITFLMALFNVRLGWWLGNPGPEGEPTYRRQGPRWAIAPFVEEAFGLTTDAKPYVYLSDGGHFENLGLYEMVRRRCRFIVVSDAGCDPNFAFEDLGNAVRKIALDLGIKIDFYGLENLLKRSADGGQTHGPYHAIGVIDYPAADGGGEMGYVLYIKAGYHGIESAGVRAYALAHPDFPHESTADQWFSESQFESYRALGFEIADRVLAVGIEKANKADKTVDSHRDLKAIIRALAP